jgi:outer membrane PBP1 activator LpoA protein
MNLPVVLAALVLAACGNALAAEPPAVPSATPVKHPTLKSCNREASAKQLSGKQREQYVKDCTAGKTAAAHAPAASSH